MTKHSLLHIVSIIFLLNSVCFLSSCNEERIESFEVETPASTHTCRMTFDVDFTGFDAQDRTTRASIQGWDNGDVVYLSFTTSDNRTVGGNATFDATNNDWTVTYTGTLSTTEQGSVKVYYCDGVVSKSGNTLTIEPIVGVYADLKGSYKYSRENGVNVSASLSPQTSRIRFKGDPGKTIIVGGIKSFSEYDQLSGALTSTLISSSVNVSSDGFTPYIYGVFEDSSKPSISINSEGCRFTKDCSSSVFQIGESGWMNVPTRAAHENWEMEEINKAHAVFIDSDNTLIFYYDDIDHTQEGIVYNMNTGKNNPEWLSKKSHIANVIFDSSFAYVKPTSTYEWFYGCSRLMSISGIKYLDTSEVTDMEDMFDGCSSLTSLDLSNFNTTAVTDMSGMFYGCTNLSNLDLSSFNTTSVTNMEWMFGRCRNLISLDLSSFNTASVKNMNQMFAFCYNLNSIDLISFNTASVTNMNLMFNDCSSLASIDISNFVVSSETTIDCLFSGCNKLSNFNVGNNDFSANDDLNSVFVGVGSPSNPCNLIIDSGFDKSVLGDYNGSYYYWRGGYFTEPIKCECVDLGLPSGTLWATFNVGASRPEEYGDYYRFGELETRDYYSIDNYNDDYSSMLTPIIYKSDSYLASLKDEYDVANVKWGNCWNMPSMKQIEELYCYCSAESELLNGVLCTKMTGPNGNSIYLPLNGYYSEDTIIGKATEGRYQCGEVIVSLDNRSYNFITLKVNKDNVNYGLKSKAISGCGVRPVQRPKQEILPISATIDNDNVQMQVGETITLTGTIYPENATYKYGVWRTYDDNIVSLDKYTGKVTAKASGTAKVYFSDSFGYLFEATCTIIVK